MIVQGGNAPMVFWFSEKYRVSEMRDISIMLYHTSRLMPRDKTEIFRRWGMDDVELDETLNTVSVPMTQEDSLSFESGPAKLEMKWLDSEGRIHTMKVADLLVGNREDETILGGD